MPGESDADVRIKLVTDDRATISVEQLREALRGASEHVEHSGQETRHLGNELLRADLYARGIVEGAKLVGEGFHQAVEMAEHLADAAMEATDEMNQQTRSMAGLMGFMDKGEHSMGQIRDYAAGVREELAQAGTAAGVATSAMTEMYDRVIEHGGKSTEEAKDLVGQMAIVGKVVPHGMEGLAEGFNMMELGIVRARNPLVQLISATGVLKGNAHSVAAAMQHMTPARQMELAEKAISLQAASLKGAGGVGAPTLGELKASLGNIREGFLEAVGKPLLDHVIPPLTKLRDYLSSHAEEIASFGEAIGQRLGNVVQAATQLVGDVYKGVVRDWSLIQAQFRGIDEEWHTMWGMALGDSETIHKDFTDLGREFAEAIRKAMAYVTATVETVQNLRDFFNADDAKEGFEHWGEGTARKRTQLAQDDVMEKVHQTDGKEFDESIDKYVAWAHKMGQSDDDIEKFVTNQRENHEAEMRDLETFKAKVESSDVEGLAAQIQKARDVQDAAWLGSALNYIGESDAMTKALMDGSIRVQGGFDALKDVIDRSAPELAERIKKMQRDAFGAKGIEGHGPQMNFYGGIHIKQDFRDVDPDRVIQVFRRDLVEQATSRRQSRMAMFGGL